MMRLFREDVRYPVGRVERICVLPFSFSEYLRAASKESLATVVETGDLNIDEVRHERLLRYFDDFLQTGGLPSVVRAQLEGKNFRLMRSGLISDYQQDFIRLFGETQLHLVMACFRSVANFVGSPSKNTSVIANPSTTLNNQVNEIFSRLESWRFFLRSEQRGPSPEASHRFLPKRYMFDSGVLRHLREAAIPSIRSVSVLGAAERTPLGGVLENQTAIAISSFQENLIGWKSGPSGGEIDFVISGETAPVPVECKASLKASARQYKGLVAYMERYSAPLGIIVSFAPYDRVTLSGGGSIVHLPAYALERLEGIAARKG